MTGLGTEGLVSYAGPGGWEQKLHVEPVWGTHVLFDLRSPSLPDDVDSIVAAAVAYLHQVDAWFSTYRADTPITMYRNGLMEEFRLPSVVRSVLAACAGARDLTDGVFDPWAVRGGVDPSGYVKGWAAGVVADQIVAAGVANVCVNASGDIACRGLQAPDKEWTVGITNPYDTQSVIRAVSVPDGWAIATSGLYERGSHIANTVTGDSASTTTARPSSVPTPASPTRLPPRAWWRAPPATAGSSASPSGRSTSSRTGVPSSSALPSPSCTAYALPATRSPHS
jgi:FAD:protein FMN transferase